MKSSKLRDQYLLAPGVTVANYLAFAAANPPDRPSIAAMVKRRFEARFIEPVCDSGRVRGGFAAMVLCCTAIQALQSFRSGAAGSNTAGAIDKFIRDNHEFNSLRGHEHDFYEHVRNALHHQAQTTGGWRINLSGPVFSAHSMSIGAQAFVDGFVEALGRYCSELERTNDASPLWAALIRKMNFVMETCDAEPVAVASVEIK